MLATTAARRNIERDARGSFRGVQTRGTSRTRPSPTRSRCSAGDPRSSALRVAARSGRLEATAISLSATSCRLYGVKVPDALPAAIGAAALPLLDATLVKSRSGQAAVPGVPKRNPEKSILRCANSPANRPTDRKLRQNAVSFTQRRFGKGFRRASRTGNITVASWQSKSSRRLLAASPFRNFLTLLHGLLTVPEVARQFEFNSLQQGVLDVRDSPASRVKPDGAVARSLRTEQER